MRADLDTRDIAAALRAIDANELASPPVNAAAVSGLKFSAALPPGLAEQTVAARLGDRPGAATTLAEHRTILHSGS
jgi:ATP-dependent Lhr-like helicase